MRAVIRSLRYGRFNDSRALRVMSPKRPSPVSVSDKVEARPESLEDGAGEAACGRGVLRTYVETAGGFPGLV